MKFRIVAKNIGTLLMVEAVCMVPSLVVALIYGERLLDFGIPIAFALVVGGGAHFLLRAHGSEIFARDGFAIVGFGWIVVSCTGALPYLLSGVIQSPVDALFEAVSGFSTTSATIIRNLETLPQSVLFWRSFTQWMGGLGFLVLMLAVLPAAKANMVHIMRAESPGPTSDKFVPQIGSVAKILYLIYAAMTALVASTLIAGGMSVFDALIHAFGTAATGGFSDRTLSVASFNNLFIEIVIMVFMTLFGVNFQLYHTLLFKRNVKAVVKDEELRFYLGTLAVGTLLITANTFLSGVFGSVGEALRYSSFQTVSIATTTAFTTADYSLWPMFSQNLLLILMFLGGMAGSTSGSIKAVRVLLLIKVARREITKLLHPRSIRAVKLNGHAVEEEVLFGVVVFFFLYIAVAAVAVLFVSLDGFDIVSTVSAVFACVSNIGPGFGAVGYQGQFAEFSGLSKVVLSFCMIIGRLEIYPALLLCTPTFWKRVNI